MPEMKICKAMRIARGASLADFQPRHFAERYRWKRRLSAPRTLPNGLLTLRHAYQKPKVIGHCIVCSKRPSFIFLFMEIIQLVAINVHDKAQHIVDQSRKPCAFIPQQVEDFRHFALGLRTDINRRAVTAIYRSEEGAFEIRQYDLFPSESSRFLYSSRLGVDICFFSSWCRCVSLGSVRIFLFRLGNPTDDFRVQRSLSGDHLTHQLLIDFDTGMLRKVCCRFVSFF